MEEILPRDETVLCVKGVGNIIMCFCKLEYIDDPSLCSVVLTRGLSTSVSTGNNHLLLLAPFKCAEETWRGCSSTRQVKEAALL